MLVNRELIRPPQSISDGFDLHLLGDCDDVVQHICARLGWELPPLPQPITAPEPADIATSVTLPIPKAEAQGGEGTGRLDIKGIQQRDPLKPPIFVPPNVYKFAAVEDDVVKKDTKKDELDAAAEGVDYEEIVTW